MATPDAPAPRRRLSTPLVLTLGLGLTFAGLFLLLLLIPSSATELPKGVEIAAAGLFLLWAGGILLGRGGGRGRRGSIR
ncbi:MAG TPA: hypothetical protein VJS68_03660 [Thermoplasmata archaeon]|nr:hypothetical protein [Thermoplasmata archaeon]